MKIAYSIVLLFLLSWVSPAGAQSLIGRHAQDVEQYMHAHQREYALDQSTRNTAYHYLKYVDRLGYKTLLVFLSDQDTCTWYKVIYDSDLYEKVRDKLNECCQSQGIDTWIEEINGKRYRKVLKKDDWFFSVTTRPEDPSVEL